MFRLSRLVLIGIILGLLVIALPAAAQENGVITGNGAMTNLHTGPGFNYPAQVQLQSGQAVVILTRSGEWVQVRAGVWTGWVYFRSIGVYRMSQSAAASGLGQGGGVPAPTTYMGLGQGGGVPAPTYYYPPVSALTMYSATGLGQGGGVPAPTTYILGQGGGVSAPVLAQNPATTAAQVGGYVGIVKSPSINVRSGPGLQYGSLFGLNQGALLTLIGQNSTGEWYLARVQSGADGWVFAQYIRAPEAANRLPVRG